MTPPPDEPRAWLDKADADLRAARVLQEVADLPRELAAFHFQHRVFFSFFCNVLNQFHVRKA